MAPDLSAGNCAGTEDLMYPDPRSHAGVKRAKLLCRGCPLRTVCGDYAIGRGDAYGVWGGFSEGERLTIRRRMGLAA